jgi:hypothetical protein
MLEASAAPCVGKLVVALLLTVALSVGTIVVASISKHGERSWLLAPLSNT